uniref:Uncharacterized protein n=1 Tax=Magallana gigas TaxID=29159 RepID=K1R2U4_MAGGI
MTKMCLEKAVRDGYTSISFPALGTGVYDYSGASSAKGLFDAIVEFLDTILPTRIRESSLWRVPISTHLTDQGLYHGWKRYHSGRKPTKHRQCKEGVGESLNSIVYRRSAVNEIYNGECTLLHIFSPFGSHSECLAQFFNVIILVC